MRICCYLAFIHFISVFFMLFTMASIAADPCASPTAKRLLHHLRSSAGERGPFGRRMDPRSSDTHPNLQRRRRAPTVCCFCTAGTRARRRSGPGRARLYAPARQSGYQATPHHGGVAEGAAGALPHLPLGNDRAQGIVKNRSSSPRQIRIYAPGSDHERTAGEPRTNRGIES